MQGNMQDFLQQLNWAVIGVSNDPLKFGNKVYLQLKKVGYNVYAVNPKLDQINNDPCYPSLSALPMVPDVISVVVPPNISEKIIDESYKLGIQRVWLQPGSESEIVIQKAHDYNIKIIENQCVLIQTKARKDAQL